MKTPGIALLIFLCLAHAIPSRADDLWSLHSQLTTITQGHGGFPADYSGPNSLSDQPEVATSLTTTLFLGRKLWKGGELYVDPEVTGGSGLSATRGVANFPNGEIFRVDTPDPKISIARVYLKEVFGLGGESEAIEEAPNQVAGSANVSRVTLVAGRFSLNDFFDDNDYSHDPRTQFMGWALMDNGAWDYAADTRGYTWGIYLELNKKNWAFRIATAAVPAQANQLAFDDDLADAHGDNAEFEYRYDLFSRPGIIRVLGYDNHAYMGNYYEAATNPAFNHDITATRGYSAKYGAGLNVQQELSGDLGFFSRIGWNDGRTETWCFTEIDNVISLGLSLKGRLWGRSDDTAGAAFVSSGISGDHQAYLAAGGNGFMLGDGALSYGREQTEEIYYSFVVIGKLSLSADYQFVSNPGFNTARGPVSIFAGRLHYEL